MLYLLFMYINCFARFMYWVFIKCIKQAISDIYCFKNQYFIV